MRHDEAWFGGEDRFRRVLWVLLARVLTVTFLLGFSAWFQLHIEPQLLSPPLLSLYVLIAVTYVITAISVVSASRVEHLDRFVYFQLFWDILFTTTVVYLTGGVNSFFIIFYCFCVIYASVLIERIGWVLSASLCSLTHSGLLALQQIGFITPFSSLVGQAPSVAGNVYYSSVIYGAAFFAVGAFTNYLSGQLRETGRVLKEKTIDYAELATLTSDILQSLNTGLLTVDRAGRITSFNQAAERITGLRFADVFGRSLTEVLPELGTGVRGSGGTVADRWEGTIQTAGGESRHLGLSLTGLHNGFGEEVGLVVSFQDISRVKEMERELRRSDRLAAVGELAAGLAHEIRNPLGSMSGSIQMLREGLTLDPAYERLMGIVSREMDRLDRLIANFLQFARPSQPDPRPVGLAVLTEETLDLLRLHPDASGVEVKTDIEPGLRVFADLEQLRQVLWNLVLNAVQAMKPSGGGTLSITAQSNGPAVVISLEDTGPGVPPEVLDRIFDPFFTTRPKGSGLGLSVVHRIVEAHRGRISVGTGADGRGARFVIELAAPPA
ncbi:MAG: PAS domain S-box protein [Deltaproteobacteria bacterium]|nr:PAS domain S-box protein [Deltaproteobacteria bacterium]